MRLTGSTWYADACLESAADRLSSKEAIGLRRRKPPVKRNGAIFASCWKTSTKSSCMRWRILCIRVQSGNRQRCSWARRFTTSTMRVRFGLCGDFMMPRPQRAEHDVARFLLNENTFAEPLRGPFSADLMIKERQANNSIWCRTRVGVIIARVESR